MSAPALADAIALSRTDDGFSTVLSPQWTIGGRPHGGYLMALLAKAGVAALDGNSDHQALDPLAVSAEFLRAPETDTASLRTDVRKRGRTANVISVELTQGDRRCVQAAVTSGQLPDEPPAWTALPDMPAEPPPSAVRMLPENSAGMFNLGRLCETMMDPEQTAFMRGETGGPLRLRLWTRPTDGPPDLSYALVAGDISPPVTFQLGRFGWSPTVQMTALLRARPAPGWLRVQIDCTAVHGAWFDADATVIDSTGRLICQCRQLALSARTDG
ncbi:MAG: thioesterase family protein [Sciscionella sp.]|nr:thioesterase family protein [Sciscionella sp.]